MTEFLPPSGGEKPPVSEPVGQADSTPPADPFAAPGDTFAQPNGALPPDAERPLAGDEARPPAEEEPKRRQLNPLLELVLILVCAFGLWYVVNGWIVKPYRIPSASMEPTLMIGDRVLVSRFIYRIHSPHRYDVVVFHPPGTGQTPVKGATTEAAVTFIKRIIGLPGETVIVKPTSITVCTTPTSGCHVLKEPFLPKGTLEGSGFGTYHVPKGDYFMMGDNRGDSEDSRSWGPLPGKYIIGEAFATYWPLNRIGTL